MTMPSEGSGSDKEHLLSLHPFEERFWNLVVELDHGARKSGACYASKHSDWNLYEGSFGRARGGIDSRNRPTDHKLDDYECAECH